MDKGFELHNELGSAQRKDLGYFPYSREELSSLPPGLEDYSMGAYNPIKHANLKAGDIVLDVGCGAGIDVFENEPPRNSPLLKLDCVFLTPHIGASTKE